MAPMERIAADPPLSKVATAAIGVVERPRHRVRGAFAAARVLALAAAVFWFGPSFELNQADYACMTSVEGDGQYRVEWQLGPLPHWDCTVTHPGGVQGRIDLGWRPMTQREG